MSLQIKWSYRLNHVRCDRGSRRQLELGLYTPQRPQSERRQFSSRPLKRQRCCASARLRLPGGAVKAQVHLSGNSAGTSFTIGPTFWLGRRGKRGLAPPSKIEAMPGQQRKGARTSNPDDLLIYAERIIEGAESEGQKSVTLKTWVARSMLERAKRGTKER